MDSNRFMHLRELLGYDNLRMSKMLNIDIEEVEAFCLGTKQISEKLAKELEDFVDWSFELSHTETKRDLAKKYLNRSD
jgi:plasmid maintenance system antidote protein VapI